MSPQGLHPAASQGFARNAADYERSRPTYPAAAVSCIVGRCGLHPGRRVLDLAAGTGKLTELLVPSGATVLAVEPVDAMAEQLRAKLPEVEVMAGAAEAIPLAPGTVDAVTVGQAFHWFDAGRALTEIQRVLVPEGVLALVWNMRDRSMPWVRAFGDLLLDRDIERPYDAYYDVDYPQVVGQTGLFTSVQSFACQWEQPCDEDLLVARAASVSVVGAMEEAERLEVLDRVRNLARAHPDLAGRATWGFPYTTQVYWCQRR